jgi:ABC-type antimicrobial peptide transport system permease subunit
VVIIDETLARKLWPNGDALGQRVQWDAESAQRIGLGSKAGEPPPSLEVVGIARPTRDGYEQREMGNSVYVPFAQGFMSNVHFLVRPAVATPAAAHALIDGVRRELSAAAPGVPVFKVTTFREHRDSSIEVWGLRLIGMLFVLFSGLALLIAVIGLYGVKAHAVSRRTREIGIRLALGAEPRAVRNLIMREGLQLTLAGLLPGLITGAAAGRLMSGLFVSMPAFDPAGLFVAAGALLAAASLACWLPARRATKVDPMVALRTE